ncbi:hypothetical protein, partial [Mesomycoplasma hyorhinis]|uniref:hypothetical protein n=1 Tax=Mesomycoplasma hyorhinis TaxID=2100 RepID=UPI001C042E45
SFRPFRSSHPAPAPDRTRVTVVSGWSSYPAARSSPRPAGGGLFFFLPDEAAYEVAGALVGSEICVRGRLSFSEKKKKKTSAPVFLIIMWKDNFLSILNLYIKIKYIYLISFLSKWNLEYYITKK